MEGRFYKGKGPTQLLMRFNANAITELMCHTAAPPRHALLSSTDGHFVEASKGDRDATRPPRRSLVGEKILPAVSLAYLLSFGDGAPWSTLQLHCLLRYLTI